MARLELQVINKIFFFCGKVVVLFEPFRIVELVGQNRLSQIQREKPTAQRGVNIQSGIPLGWTQQGHLIAVRLPSVGLVNLLSCHDKPVDSCALGPTEHIPNLQP